MKKTKLFMPFLTSSVLLTVAPTMFMTSCTSAEKEETHFEFVSTSSSPKENEFKKTESLAKEFIYKFKSKESSLDLSKVSATAIITQSNSNFSIVQAWIEHDSTTVTVHIDVVVKIGVFSLKDKDGKPEKKQETKFDIKLSDNGWVQKETGFSCFAQPIE